MFRFSGFRWLVLLLIVAIEPQLDCRAQAVALGGPDVQQRLELEQSAFALVNQYRAGHDLPPLKWDDGIAAVARGHSRDMANGDVDFGHDGFRDRVGKIMDAMPDLRGAGENVFKTDDSNDVAQHAVSVWLHSPHHLENIRGDFNYSGMGVALDKDGVFYFTQFFVKIAPTKAEPAAHARRPVVSPFGIFAQPTEQGSR